MFYTISEVAKITGKTTKTIYSWVESGNLPSKRIGKSVLVPKSALNAALIPILD